MKKRKTTTMGKIIAIGIIGILLSSGLVSVSAVWTDLYAGRDQKITGDVHVWRSGGQLNVRYTTESGWTLSETHLAVATSFEDIPQTKKGNPKIGRFPYSSDHPEGTETYTYVINLYDYFPDGDWSGNTLYFAAHAVVSHPDWGEETAWADTWGQYFPGNSIALFFTITFP
ncbi:MAG: hypothetical protein ACTSRI_17505 [Promethearchaeota archaeon]